jgi:hypothetical protein
MAEETKTCEVCNTEAATQKCSQCEIPLCPKCAKEFIMQFGHPALSIKGHEKAAIGRVGKEKNFYCSNCLDNLDVPDLNF